MRLFYTKNIDREQKEGFKNPYQHYSPETQVKLSIGKLAKALIVNEKGTKQGMSE